MKKYLVSHNTVPHISPKNVLDIYDKNKHFKIATREDIEIVKDDIYDDKSHHKIANVKMKDFYNLPDFRSVKGFSKGNIDKTEFNKAFLGFTKNIEFNGDRRIDNALLLGVPSKKEFIISNWQTQEGTPNKLNTRILQMETGGNLSEIKEGQKEFIKGYETGLKNLLQKIEENENVIEEMGPIEQAETLMNIKEAEEKMNVMKKAPTKKVVIKSILDNDLDKLGKNLRTKNEIERDNKIEKAKEEQNQKKEKAENTIKKFLDRKAKDKHIKNEVNNTLNDMIDEVEKKNTKVDYSYDHSKEINDLYNIISSNNSKHLTKEEKAKSNELYKKITGKDLPLNLTLRKSVLEKLKPKEAKAETIKIPIKAVPQKQKEPKESKEQKEKKTKDKKPKQQNKQKVPSSPLVKLENIFGPKKTKSKK